MLDGNAQVRQLRYNGRHRKGLGQVVAFRARGRRGSLPVAMASSPVAIGSLAAEDATGDRGVRYDGAGVRHDGAGVRHDGAGVRHDGEPVTPEADQAPSAASASQPS